MSNITQVVRVDKKMTSMKKWIIASGLDQLLTTRGPFTLLVPSDDAFAKLSDDTKQHYLKPENKLELTTFINRHIINGQVNYKDLKEGDRLKSIDGKDLVVTMSEGSFLINGSSIQSNDVKTSNGVIYSLNDVLKN
jgi:uncharacterized surface protein with fasciclin (FAS1) repeats